MSALAWPLVALVAVGAAVYLVRRWQDRAVAVEAARKVLADSMADVAARSNEALSMATKAQSAAAGVKELENRVGALEIVTGLRA